jgi:hypothetical protein
MLPKKAYPSFLKLVCINSRISESKLLKLNARFEFFYEGSSLKISLPSAKFGYQ